MDQSLLGLEVIASTEQYGIDLLILNLTDCCLGSIPRQPLKISWFDCLMFVLTNASFLPEQFLQQVSNTIFLE